MNFNFDDVFAPLQKGEVPLARSDEDENKRLNPQGKRYQETVTSLSQKKIKLFNGHELFFTIQGISLKQIEYIADPNYVHLHNNLAEARAWAERSLFKHVSEGYTIFEVACSSRTISWEYCNMHYNRPIISGFNADVDKLNKLVAMNSIKARCSHLADAKFCDCAKDKDIIFSVDVAYYIMAAIIHSLKTLRQRNLHVMHLFDEDNNEFFCNKKQQYLEGCFGLKEGAPGVFYELEMQVFGNNTPYKHRVFATMQRPYTQISETEYLIYHPLATINTGGSMYGLFELTISNKKCDPLFDFVNLPKTIPLRDEKLKEKEIELKKRELQVIEDEKKKDDVVKNNKEEVKKEEVKDIEYTKAPDYDGLISGVKVHDVNLLNFTETKSGVYYYNNSEGKKEYLVVGRETSWLYIHKRPVAIKLSVLITTLKALLAVVNKAVINNTPISDLRMKLFATFNNNALCRETNISTFPAVCSLVFHQATVMQEGVDSVLTDTRVIRLVDAYRMKGIVERFFNWMYRNKTISVILIILLAVVVVGVVPGVVSSIVRTGDKLYQQAYGKYSYTYTNTNSKPKGNNGQTPSHNVGDIVKGGLAIPENGSASYQPLRWCDAEWSSAQHLVPLGVKTPPQLEDPKLLALQATVWTQDAEATEESIQNQIEHVKLPTAALVEVIDKPDDFEHILNEPELLEAHAVIEDVFVEDTAEVVYHAIARFIPPSPIVLWEELYDDDGYFDFDFESVEELINFLMKCAWLLVGIWSLILMTICCCCCICCTPIVWALFHCIKYLFNGLFILARFLLCITIFMLLEWLLTPTVRLLFCAFGANGNRRDQMSAILILCSMIYVYINGSTALVVYSLGNPGTSAITFQLFIYLLLSFMVLFFVCMYAGLTKTVTNINNKDNEEDENSIISSICIPAAGMEPLTRDLDNTRWNVRGVAGEKVSFDDKDALCDCNERRTKKMKKLAPFSDTSYPHIYHSCFRNNFSSIRRQTATVLQAERAVLDKFRLWYDGVFNTEIVPLLEKVVVDTSQWINHLETKKQSEVLPYFDHPDNKLYDHCIGMDDVAEMSVYNNFVKSEKQFAPLKEKGVEYSKTRCICSPGAKYKFVMGPVVLELERIFKKEFFGYVTPANWSEYERLYDELDEVGLDQTLQIDGSGFDTTQHQEIKEIVDHSIYKWLLDNLKITHVDNDVFRAVALSCWRTIKLSAIHNGKVVSYGNVMVRGRVFSGSCDTTYMNTMRMTLYNRFVMECLLGFVPRDDYYLLVKGDDVALFVRCMTGIVDAYKQVFGSKGQIGRHGLGQIAKYYKIGSIEHIDFCSQNVIKTDHGYKVIRKLLNLVDKEHYSVKAANYNTVQLERYNHDIYESMLSWCGGCKFIIEYFNLIYNKRVKHVVKPKNVSKFRFVSLLDEEDKGYLNRVKSYEEHLKEDERVSQRPLDSMDLESWVSRMEDEELSNAYMTMFYRTIDGVW